MEEGVKVSHLLDLASLQAEFANGFPEKKNRKKNFLFGIKCSAEKGPFAAVMIFFISDISSVSYNI